MSTVRIASAFPAKDRSVLRRAVLFYRESLLGGRSFDSLLVLLAEEQDTKRFAGICEQVAPPAARAFRIRIRRAPLAHQLQILAHECVHVAQFLRGDLAYAMDDDGDRVFQWCGTLYPPMLNMVAAKIYDDTPWEQEAIAQDASLANSFIDHAIKRGWLTEDSPAAPDGGA